MGMPRAALVGFLFLMLSGIASAQTNVYGTLKCDPLTMGRTASSGKAGQKIVTSQQKCFWTQPLQLAGSQTKDTQITTRSAVEGLGSVDSGDQITKMVSGDQFSVHFGGTSHLDSGGETTSQQGTWTFSSGTGALMGITGQGSYMGFRGATGTLSYDIQGAYALPKNP